MIFLDPTDKKGNVIVILSDIALFCIILEITVAVAECTHYLVIHTKSWLHVCLKETSSKTCLIACDRKYQDIRE
jgi:hypothetical protein